MLPRGAASPSRQRFPSRPQGYVDADEKRATAISGDLRRAHSSAGLKIRPAEWKLLALVVLVALGVRLFRISHPDSVVFDEVHFGKFASKYIKTQYYVDVHPPLAKLLITLVAFVRGFDGEFDFKDIAKIYENTPYTSMRLLPGLMGVAVIPLAYLTLRELDCGATTALLGSIFILFENGYITQSRHILLDSPLIFFTALTLFFWVAFSNEDRDRSRAFTEQWWLWLTLTGLSLGAVVSCKWVGLFTIATVGVDTIRQLWRLLGDLRVPPRLFIKHFLARALCLIVVPVFFYMSMFAIHFQILQNSGDGDGFMSSPFQHTLSGRGMEDTYADIALGSEITMRHLNTQGGYLHSHPHSYPAGSTQQQVTLYPHRDENNVWRILNATEEGRTEADYATAPLTYVRHGMIIRLQHLPTEKRLHSHNIRPPVSDVDFQNEVSGYGFPGFVGDANDNWAVEIEEGDKHDRESSRRLRTLHTIFRLRHTLTGCYLFSHKVKLPEWGFEQQEVTCNTNAVKPNSLWYMETNTHSQLHPGDERVNYKLPGFFGKFWELQQVMWTTNAGLTDRHVFDSRPYTWPFLRRGINFWVKDHRQIYLLGNPFIWWLSTASVVLYAVVRVVLVLREKRGYQDFNHSRVVKYDSICSLLVIGWALHYLPFFLMQRQLFLHHYFPALYFAILVSCGIFDLVTATLRPQIRLQVAGILAIIAIYNFAHFSPLTYGGQWTRSQCLRAEWLKTWDFSCNDFHQEYSQYHEGGRILSTLDKVPVATVGGEDGRPAVVVDDPVAGEKLIADAMKTTEGLRGAAAAPGPNVFEQKVAEQVNSVESKPAPLPPRPIESLSITAGAAGMAPNDIPVVLPPEPEDLMTPEETDSAAVQTAVAAPLENLVLNPEAPLLLKDQNDESVSLTLSPIVDDAIATSSGTTLASSPSTPVKEVEEDLARMQEALFGDD